MVKKIGAHKFALCRCPSGFCMGNVLGIVRLALDLRSSRARKGAISEAWLLATDLREVFYFFAACKSQIHLVGCQVPSLPASTGLRNSVTAVVSCSIVVQANSFSRAISR